MEHGRHCRKKTGQGAKKVEQRSREGKGRNADQQSSEGGLSAETTLRRHPHSFCRFLVMSRRREKEFDMPEILRIDIVINKIRFLVSDSMRQMKRCLRYFS